MMEYDSQITIPKRHHNTESVTLHQIGADTIVHDRDQKQVHVLNETSRLIWEYCDGTATVEEIGARLQARYPEIASDILARDTQEAIAELYKKGLITV